MRRSKLYWVGLYALAMAYVEAATVVYLRRVFGVEDLLRDVAPYDPRLAATEIGREAATLLMLLAVGGAAGRSRQSRWGAAFFAFGVWDVLYYVWLRVLIAWPDSLLSQDILFLIPVPWWGPILAPVLVAILMALCGAFAVILDGRGRTLRPGRAGGALLALGIVLVLYAFMADALRALPASAEELARLKPTSFPWPAYLGGLALVASGVWRAIRRAESTAV